MFLLQTPRLILRDFRKSDTFDFVNLYRDPRYRRYYSSHECEPAFLEQLVSAFRQDARAKPRRCFQLAMVLKSCNSFIGTVGLRILGNGLASLGVGVDPSSQKKGRAREALEVLLSFGFYRLQLDMITCEIHRDNRPAVSLCLGLGFRKVNCISSNSGASDQEFFEERKYGDRTDFYICSRNEWKFNRKRSCRERSPLACAGEKIRDG